MTQWDWAESWNRIVQQEMIGEMTLSFYHNMPGVKTNYMRFVSALSLELSNQLSLTGQAELWQATKLDTPQWYTTEK